VEITRQDGLAFEGKDKFKYKKTFVKKTERLTMEKILYITSEFLVCVKKLGH